jgi:hypothetical protein
MHELARFVENGCACIAYAHDDGPGVRAETIARIPIERLVWTIPGGRLALEAFALEDLVVYLDGLPDASPGDVPAPAPVE